MFLISEKSPIALTSEHHARIDAMWKTFTAWRSVTVNDTLCRFLREEAGQITVAHDVTYKDVVGLRFKRHAQEAFTPPFQVLSAIALVYTADDLLILLERDSGDWGKSLECSGGFIRAKYMETEPFNADTFIGERVREDLELPEQVHLHCSYLGHYDAQSILEHMLVYCVTLSVDAAELMRLKTKAIVLPEEYTPREHEEHTKLPLHKPSRAVLERFHTK